MIGQNGHALLLPSNADKVRQKYSSARLKTLDSKKVTPPVFEKSSSKNNLCLKFTILPGKKYGRLQNQQSKRPALPDFNDGRMG